MILPTKQKQTNVGTERYDPDGRVGEPNCEEPGTLLGVRNFSQVHANDLATNLLPLGKLVQVAAL